MTDTWQNAKDNARPDCPRCKGTGTYMYDHNHGTICNLCCKHNMGWWKLQLHYGENNGKWCCSAGCGHVIDEKPEKDGYWACVYCGDKVPEEHGLASACCGEVNHTEWVEEE